MGILNNQQIKSNKSLIAVAVAAVMAAGNVGYPMAASALANNSANNSNVRAGVVDNAEMQKYHADITALNSSDVTGTAKFKVKDNTLKISIYAEGLEPGVHPQHIHGKEEMKAECPTEADDANGDGFLSVLEGAPAYGPIKMNLTSPQTAFGTPPTPALFTEFAGTPNNNDFPVVGEDGILDFTQTYTFENNAAAQAAKASLLPLGDQHIVIHGGTAPKSVDATAFAALGAAFPEGTDLNEEFYDVLLPVGCGEIETGSASSPETSGNGGGHAVVNPGVQKLASLTAVQAQLVQDLTHDNGNDYNDHVVSLSATFTSAVDAAVAQYHANMAAGMNKDEARNQLINALSSAKDAVLNGLTEARNQHIDMLNREGDVAKRDAFLHDFDMTVNQYADKLEKAKNDL